MAATSKSTGPASNKSTASQSEPKEPATSAEARQPVQPVANVKGQQSAEQPKATGLEYNIPEAQADLAALSDKGTKFNFKREKEEKEEADSSFSQPAAEGADPSDSNVMIAQADIGGAGVGVSAAATTAEAAETAAAGTAGAAGTAAEAVEATAPGTAEAAGTAGAAEGAGVSAGMLALGAVTVSAIAAGVVIAYNKSKDSPDTTPPEAPTVTLVDDTGADASDKVTHIGTLSLAGIEDGATVEYSTDGGATWTSTFTADEGVNNVQVRQTDAAGNQSVAANFSFTLDTTAAAPTVALASDTGSSGSDKVTSAGTMNVTGTETGATIEYSIDGGTTWTSTFAAAEGMNDVQVRQTDAAGNQSDAASLSFTLDTTAAAPTVALASDTGADNADKITSDDTLSVTGETEATVEYSTDGGATWTSTFTAEEGVNDIHVRQTDAAGNQSVAASFSFTLDTTAAAPTVALASDTGSSGSDKVTSAGTMNVTGTETGATIEYSIDGGTTWTSTFAAAEGMNDVQVRQTDAAGNQSDAASLSFTLDTTAAAPTVALASDTGADNADKITSDDTLSVTGETEATVEYSIDSGTTWTSTFAASEGVNDVQVRQTDAAGNQSNATSFSFTFDATAPAIQAFSVSGNQVVLIYGEALDGANIPAADAFTVIVGGAANVVTNVSVSGTSVTLTMTDSVPSGAAVTINYDDPTTGNDVNALQDAAGNDAASFSTGVVSDGYIRGAQIYIDSDNDGIADVGEALAGVTTDANGQFILPADAPSGAILAVGGINIDTNVPNTLVLKAPAGSKVISPLTTLVQEVIKSTGASTAEASATVVTALGLTVGTDLTTYDPIAALTANAEDVTALAVQKAAAQVATLVTMATESPAEGLSGSAVAEAVIGNLVAQIGNPAAPTTIDLKDNTVVTNALGTASTADSTVITGHTSDIATASTLAEIATQQAQALDDQAPATPTVALTSGSDSGVSSTDLLTNDTTPTIRVNFDSSTNDGTAAMAGDTVTVLQGVTTLGTAILTATDIANGYADLTLSALAGDGDYTLTATITDAVGNQSAASDSLTIDLDATAPDEPGIDAATTDNVINAAEAAAGVTVTGTTETGTTVTVNGEAATVDGATWSATLSAAAISGFGEGAETLTVVATDQAGNSTTATHDLTVNTAPPAVPTFDVVATDNIINAAEAAAGVTITGTTETGTTMTVNGETATVNGATWSATLSTAAIEAFGEGSETLTVVATNGVGNTATATHDLTVDTVAPAFTSATTSTFDENATGTAHTAAATDTMAITYGLGGTDGAQFTIDPSSGALSFVTTPDFETPADTGGNNVYDVSITATDVAGNANTQAVGISVTDINEAPLSSPATSTDTLVINQPFSDSIVDLFSDVDADDTLTYTATGLPAGVTLTSDGVVSGTLTETGTAEIVFTATDSGGLTATHTVSVNIVSAPVINSIAADVELAKADDALTFTATISEPVTVVGTPILTLDVGGQEMTATYTGGTDTNTLTFTATAPAGDSAAVAVSAISLDGGSITGNSSGQDFVTTATGQVVSSFLIDNSNPVFTSAAAASFAENGSGGAYSAVATDATAVAYTLGGTDATLFNIDSVGAVTFKAAPDFEAPVDSGTDNVYDVTVTATDALGHFATQAVAITVTDVNEPPSLTSGATANLAENGTGTVYAATATDPDASTTLTYGLTGVDADLFTIAPSTGAVTFNAVPNHEAPADSGGDNVYDFSVTASDGTNTVSQAVAVTVTDVNEVPTLTSGAIVSYQENGTGTAYTVTATDPDASTTLAYGLIGADADLFTIDPSTGAVTFNAVPNYEAPADSGGDNVYDFSVTASDGTNTVSQAVAATVTDVNEAPTSSAVTAAAAVVGQSYSLDVASAGSFSDVDAGDSLTYTATGLPTGLTIDSATGVISGTAEAVSSASVTVTATDEDGLSDSQPFTLAVIEAPAITNTATLDGISNLDVRSEIILTFSDTIQLGSGEIRIMDDMGTSGWTLTNTTTGESKQDVTDNDVVITLTDGDVTGLTIGGVDKSAEMADSVSVNGDKLIISPAGSDDTLSTDWDFDWDFGADYHIELDTGVVTANGVGNVAISDSTTLNFTTVTPAGDATGAASQTMAADGTMADSLIYHHGHVADATADGYAMNFGTGSHALVLQSEGGGDTRTTTIGGKVLLSGLGIDDIIYMDNGGDMSIATTDGFKGANYTGSGNSNARLLDNVDGGTQLQTVFADYADTGWTAITSLKGGDLMLENVDHFNANIVVFG